MASLIDREALAKNVYNDTVKPLYSMVPEGLEFATEAFADEYGEAPDPDRAAQLLKDAGIQTPVDVDLWWTPTHYGSVSADEYAELERQFEAGGLFDVTLDSAEWNQYSEVNAQDQYPVFQLGWFPDFPDADNYTSPFFFEGGYYNSHYSNAADQRADHLRPRQPPTTPSGRRRTPRSSRSRPRRSRRSRSGRASRSRPSSTASPGVEDTFDPSFSFRIWMISKS